MGKNKCVTHKTNKKRCVTNKDMGENRCVTNKTKQVCDKEDNTKQVCDKQGNTKQVCHKQDNTKQQCEEAEMCVMKKRQMKKRQRCV